MGVSEGGIRSLGSSVITSITGDVSLLLSWRNGCLHVVPGKLVSAMTYAGPSDFRLERPSGRRAVEGRTSFSAAVSAAEGGSISGPGWVESGISSLTAKAAARGSGSTGKDKSFGALTSSTGDGIWDTTDPRSSDGEGLAFGSSMSPTDAA
jgi:hypothetical protein